MLLLYSLRNEVSEYENELFILSLWNGGVLSMNDDRLIAFTGNDDILSILDLDRADIESLNIRHDLNKLIIEITLARKKHKCPVCSCETDKIKAYQMRKITHSVINNTPCVIHYNARRYICPFCGKTFYEHNPFAYQGSKMSVATVFNVLTALKDPAITFTSVASQFDLSSSSVANIFDKHVNISRRTLPECICFDETYAFKSEKSNYICVLLDYNSKQIIDILPTRYKNDLFSYFYAIPLEERKKVRYVSFDMWQTYRVVAREMFPNSTPIVDKFHILQELMRRATRVRVRVMNRHKKILDTLREKEKKLKEEKKKLSPQEEEQLYIADRNYYLLKKFNWVLFSNEPKIDDPNCERKMNHKLNRYCNLNDLYHMVIAIDDELREAVEIRDSIHAFYKNTKHEDAREELNKMIYLCKHSNIPEISSFSKTLIEWKPEIINSFIHIESINGKMNNALIENRNKAIKLLKHSSNGYQNWKRFRNRVLYSLNEDSTFTL